MSEDSEGLRDRLVDEFSSTISGAQEKLRRANEASGDKARELRSQVEAQLLRAKLRLQELRGQAMDRGRAAAQATDTYVHENPWPVLGTAVLVGFVVGLLATRR